MTCTYIKKLYLCCRYSLYVQVKTRLNKLKQRSIIEILRNSLADKPNYSQSSDENTQNEVRYKLIIDPSEDESITRLLFMFGILKHENTRTYICSDFLGDRKLQKVNYKLF